MSVLRWFLMLTVCGALAARAADTPKVQLKNATEWKVTFLGKLPSYVKWPDNSFLPGQEKKIIIGILGPDPFDGLLDEFVKGTLVQGRELVVMKFEDPAEASKCQLLFVPASQVAKWQEAAKSMKVSGLLVVGESKDFAQADGVANLDFAKKAIEINSKAAGRAGLIIQPQLLSMSTKVKDK